MHQSLRAGFLCAFLAAAAVAQQQPAAQPNDQNQQSLGDVARRQRELKEQQARSAGNPSNSAAAGGKSLADVAREQQDKKYEVVRTTVEDSRKLAASIDEVLDFASRDSGYSKRFPVKHQLISEADVSRRIAESMDKSDSQRLVSSELVLKKFGFLPNSFDLKAFLTGPGPKHMLAFYDPKTKMVNLLNWVEISEQLPILAHELTHALQDQNYDLLKWRRYNAQRQPPPPKMRVDTDDEEESGARLAVVEGQAEIVRYDYMLKSYDRSLANTPQIVDLLQDAATRTYDDVVAIHDAPLILKESSIFPYREGLNFELELFRTGGKPMAFAGAFIRPPRDTHDILQPAAYISNQKMPSVPMPDLAPVLADEYEPYDSGVMGELDVRVMARQFGREEDALSLASNWQGGAYVAVKRSTGVKAPAANDKLAQAAAGKAVQASSDRPSEASAEKAAAVSADKPHVPGNNLVPATEKPTQASTDKPATAAAEKPRLSTRDLALLYVSRWKTADAAHRFLEIYKNSLSKRVLVLDSKNLEPGNCAESSPTCGPLSAIRVTTDEGPVFLEIWPNNVVFIAHSFDAERVNRLQRAVLMNTPIGKTNTSTADLKPGFTPGLGSDLSLRLFALPEFQAFHARLDQEIESSLSKPIANAPLR